MIVFTQIISLRQSVIRCLCLFAVFWTLCLTVCKFWLEKFTKMWAQFPKAEPWQYLLFSSMNDTIQSLAKKNFIEISQNPTRQHVLSSEFIKLQTKTEIPPKKEMLLKRIFNNPFNISLSFSIVYCINKDCCLFVFWVFFSSVELNREEKLVTNFSTNNFHSQDRFFWNKLELRKEIKRLEREWKFSNASITIFNCDCGDRK